MIYKFGELPGVVTRLGSFHVKVQFPTATGVQRDTPVRFCGYQIGRVTDVNPPKVIKDLNTNKFYHQTLVILSIDKQYSDIPKNVEVKLLTRGLGSSYIELKLKGYDVNEPAGPFLGEGSLLQGSTGMTSEFFPEESQKKLFHSGQADYAEYRRADGQTY
jgi:ABC-type transporter Mla subunit MlaD